ncbi:NUDIX domain-containing protein [Streptomyces sp. NPDC101490]|uniref:NUDIX domain-containing protein n=1 Tax=Streptomyces sp. NPDC101490 TaxID=3366143 RepID=UPI0037F21FCF
MSTETEMVQFTADIVCVRGGDVLLIERGWPPFQGRLALPGGYVDSGETARAAAVRELAEETGIQVNEADLTLVGLYDAPGRDPRGRFVSAAFMVTVPATTTARAGDDAAAVCWVPFDTPGQPLAFDHTDIVREALCKTPAIAINSSSVKGI